MRLVPVRGTQPDMSHDWTSALARARAHAPYLALGLDRLPELEALLQAGRGEEALAMAKAAGDAETDTGMALRREKHATSIALAIGDLAGAFPLSRVTGELSALADHALDQALAASIRSSVPDAEPAGFLALALGKHGAKELNYSSDIDPILLYDPETLPRRRRDEPGDAAQRVARRVVDMLSRVTGDGYVFRVDLRLRPAAEISPLAISFDAALTHYESSALAWERAAFIRARACAGDIAMGQEFLNLIRPFIWRKSLDFGAIAEISRLIRRIRDDYHGPTRPGLGFDLKRGRGGIREIEFFAQTHQLIYGGRMPSLRQRGTRATLEALATAGLVSQADAQLMIRAYERLRMVEHRLQMVSDQQTHALPERQDALDNVAQLDGMADGAALIAELDEITGEVGLRFDRLIEQTTGDKDHKPATGQASLSTLLETSGFQEPEALVRRIEGWMDGRVRSLRSEAARSAFDAILPALIEALAAAPDPQRALARWETFLIHISSGINLFRLLEARPGLLVQLVHILSLAQPLADALARRSDLLDALIDASAFDLPGGVDDLVAQMRRLDDESDYQSKLDRIRRVVGETRFALGVQLIEAAHDPLDIAAALSRTAEAALITSADAATHEFTRNHGYFSDAGLLVLGLGRLGGGALTHASDLDLIYLHANTLLDESDGRRPLGAVVYFNRLAQRVSAALSVPTPEGALYELDTRLRPQGAQGPLVVSLDAFQRYQAESAWAWEHMALARARVLYGADRARAELEAIISATLCRPRDPVQLKTDVLAMRAEMAQHKPATGPLDTKLLRGGLVDIEFIVHYLQLKEHCGLDPHLDRAITQLAQAGLIPASLGDAHQLMSRMLVASRLLAPDATLPPSAAQAVLAKACGHATSSSLLQAFADARKIVASVWADIFATPLEIGDD